MKRRSGLATGAVTLGVEPAAPPPMMGGSAGAILHLVRQVTRSPG